MSTLKEKAGLISVVNFIVGRLQSGKTILLKNLFMESLMDENVWCFYRSTEETKESFLESVCTNYDSQFNLVDSIKEISAVRTSPSKHHVFVDNADLLTVEELGHLAKLSTLKHWTVFMSVAASPFNRTRKPSVPKILSNAFPGFYSVCTTKFKAGELTLNNKERFEIDSTNGCLFEIEDKEEVNKFGFNQCFPVVVSIMNSEPLSGFGRAKNFVGQYIAPRQSGLTAAIVTYCSEDPRSLMIVRTNDCRERILRKYNHLTPRVLTISTFKSSMVSNGLKVCRNVKKVLLDVGTLNKNSIRDLTDVALPHGEGELSELLIVLNRTFPDAKVGLFSTQDFDSSKLKSDKDD